VNRNKWLARKDMAIITFIIGMTIYAFNFADKIVTLRNAVETTVSDVAALKPQLAELRENRAAMMQQLEDISRQLNRIERQTK